MEAHGRSHEIHRHGNDMRTARPCFFFSTFPAVPQNDGEPFSGNYLGRTKPSENVRCGARHLFVDVNNDSLLFAARKQLLLSKIAKVPLLPSQALTFRLHRYLNSPELGWICHGATEIPHPFLPRHQPMTPRRPGQSQPVWPPMSQVVAKSDSL